MEDFVFELVNRPVVLKVIKFQGDLWNPFSGFLPYIRVSNNKTPSKINDELDDTILGSISDYYNQVKFLTPKLIFDKDHLQSLVVQYKGTKLPIELYIHQTLDDKQKIDNFYRRTVPTFHKKLQIILQHQPNGFHLDQIAKIYSSQLNGDVLHNCLDNAKLEEVGFK